MSTLIKLRRDTAANWAAADPVLQLGEPGYDTTNNELRIGDGTTAWSGLTPITGGGGSTYGNANVATFLAAFGSNVISTTGNVTASYFVGDGSQLTNLPAGNTGNVTFDDQIVIGTGDEYGGGGLYLAIGTASAANLQYFRVRGGDSPTHLHFDTGNNSYYDQYFGDDNKYVKLEATGNVLIQSDDGGSSAQWNFDTSGNLTIPAGGAIQTAPGSNGDIILHTDGTGRVIIQGSTSTLLTLASDAPDTQNRFEIDTYGANLGNLGGGVFTGTYRRTGSPTQTDDRLASFAGKGTEDGVSVQLPTAAKITLDAASNWSVGNTPSHISFWTTSFGSNVAAESARLTPAGNLILYSGSAIVGNGYIKTGTYTAADLPVGGATQGARAMVSDADSRTWGNLVVGGAGNVVPVWSDGSNWYIG